MSRKHGDKGKHKDKGLRFWQGNGKPAITKVGKGGMEMVLRISPMAWAKILWFKDKADGLEISGFGVTAVDDPLYMEEFHTIKQECTGSSVDIDDEDIGRYFDEQVNRGKQPKDFARIWIHTHPDGVTQPSGVDTNTQESGLGGASWTIMMVVVGEGAIARIRVIPFGNYATEGEIPVRIDWTERPFGGSDFEGWGREFDKNIKRKAIVWEVGVTDALISNRWGIAGIAGIATAGAVPDNKVIMPATMVSNRETIIMGDWALTAADIGCLKNRGFTLMEIDMYGDMLFGMTPAQLERYECNLYGVSLEQLRDEKVVERKIGDSYENSKQEESRDNGSGSGRPPVHTTAGDNTP